jgi:hypothetical protein
MATRTVKVAIWRYRDTAGVRRFARFGATVDLSEDEVERGDREGVFTPAPVPATSPTELERALANIQPRVTVPAGSDESDAAPLHHDIALTPAVLPVVEVEPTTETEPEAASEKPDTVEPVPVTEVTVPVVELKRPAKAAAHEKWVEYVSAATGRPEAELEKLTKDELQSIEV